MLQPSKAVRFVGSLMGVAWCASACAVDTAGEDAPELGVIEQPATAAAAWTGWASEEFGGPLRCPSGKTVIGVECRGSYCDQIRLRCDAFGHALTESGFESNWVESGGDIFGNGTQKDAVCPDGEWMTGIDCRGDYCDDVKIFCKASNRAASNCIWTEELYSEEQGAHTAPSNRYIRGVRCSGTHCDNKAYLTCESRPPASNSCQGRCGLESTGGTCWCDDQCARYGDCCADVAAFCG